VRPTSLSLSSIGNTLYALAADTGGKAMFDYNDLGKGMVEAAQSISSYYIIDYYTTNAALDGKFRRIRILLNGNITAALDYRQGYFAGSSGNSPLPTKSANWRMRSCWPTRSPSSPSP
jgi:VWFA-related protein